MGVPRGFNPKNPGQPPKYASRGHYLMARRQYLQQQARKTGANVGFAAIHPRAWQRHWQAPLHRGGGDSTPRTLQKQYSEFLKKRRGYRTDDLEENMTADPRQQQDQDQLDFNNNQGTPNNTNVTTELA